MFSLTQNIHYKPQLYYQQYHQQQQQQQQQSQASKQRQNLNGSFGGAMIDRIHNIRPGCGSCGK
jgi:hypothetical protein